MPRTAAPTRLPGDVHDPVPQIDVGDLEAGQLRQPQSAVQEQHDDRRVPAAAEILARADGQHLLELVGGKHRHGLLRNLRGAHSAHRVRVDLLFLDQPLEPMLDGPVAVAGGGGGGGVGGDQFRDPVLQDGPRDLAGFTDPASSQVVDQLLGTGAVGGLG